MKKFGLILGMALCLFALPAKSQILISLLFGDELNQGKMEFGLLGQFNASTVTNAESAAGLNTFGLGLFLDFNISEKWIAHFEANVKTQLGYKNIGMGEILTTIPPSVAMDSYESRRTINVIHVPMDISFRTKYRIGGGLGIYSSIMHGSRDYYFIEDGPADITFEQSFTNHLKQLDFGATASLHYHFKGKPGMQIRARINYGLINIYKDGSGLQGNNFWVSTGVAVPVIMKKKESP